MTRNQQKPNEHVLHAHCKKCNQCLITGPGHICVSQTDYVRALKFLAKYKPSHRSSI